MINSGVMRAGPANGLFKAAADGRGSGSYEGSADNKFGQSDLVVVYHRQPYEEVEVDGRVEFRENSSPNGIVPTLKSFMGNAERASWVAWKHADDLDNPGFDKQVQIEDDYGDYTVSRVPLTPDQVKQFYQVTSKEAFWGMIHSFKERYGYENTDWPNFQEVNKSFAEAAAEEAAEGATVWVHDYNLWLMPKYLREMRPDVKIEFFHHTPFPGPDVFNKLPWAKEIMQSLMACDEVGFHIPRFAQNFSRVAHTMFGGEVEKVDVPDKWVPENANSLMERDMPTKIILPNGSEVAIGVKPLGVNSDYIQELANAPETDAKVDEIRKLIGDQKLILSVGRTDFTKGGVQQLEAFERYLEKNPEMVGKVQLMHISVPANRDMKIYQGVQSGLEEAAGRINGKFGDLSWQPIALVSQPIPFTDLIPYYKAADVAWITPLMDGMNLVCKEYVTARTDGDGVLVLSEAAGAAIELHDAVMTNPYSDRSMENALSEALNMPENERRQRMDLLRSTVLGNPISNWGPTHDASEKIPANDVQNAPRPEFRRRDKGGWALNNV